uniref:PKD domain-containing protein n=1 Tax=Gadus morhua TaxID=8049 RepID=A0A8C4ZWA8_GADMO
MGTVTLLVLVLAFTSTTVARSKVQFTRFRSWNSRMYPVWRDGDSRLRNCWTGGNVSFEVRNDAPTLTGAKATFNIDLHFPTNQSVLPDGQVVWARNCTVDGRDYVEGQAVYADRASGSRGVGVFPDGSSFNRTQDRKPRYVFVWKTWGRFWQVADGPSSSLSIDTDNVPLGSYKMEVVIYHSRGDDQFIPLGYASTQFSITDQIPFTISLNQINDVNQNDQSFIQNRAIAFNVRLHDPSQYLGSSDITFNWDFGDQTGTLISRDLSVTHTYLSPGAYKPKVVLMATIPNACAETTAVAPVAPVAVVAPGDEEALVVPAAGEAVEVVLTPGDEEALVVPAAGEAVEVVLAPGDEEVVEAAVAPAGEEAVEAAVTPATVEAVEAVVVAGDEVAVEAAVVVPEAEDAVVAAVVPAAEEADEAAVAAAEGEVVEAAVAPEAEEVVEAAVAPEAEEVVEAAVAPEAEEVVEAAVAPEAEAVVEAAVAAVDEAAVPTDAAAVAVAVDGVAVEAEEALVVEAATEAVAVVTEAAPAVNVLVPAATESTAVVVEAAAAVNAEAEVAEVEFNEGAVPTVGVVAVELAAEVEVTAENEPAQVALVLTKRQAPEAPADCTVYRYGSLATSVEIIQGIESVEILQVSNVVSLTTELGQNAVDLTISCQGSLPSEVCTVVSDADCVTPVETVCGVALPSPDCQLVLRQFFNGSGEFCVNVSLTNDVSLAVTSARVSVTVGSSGSPAGTAATVLGVMVIVGIMGTIGLMYRRVKQYQPLREEGEGSGVNTITSVPLLLWNLLSRQSPGESRPLLQSRGV